MRVLRWIFLCLLLGAVGAAAFLWMSGTPIEPPFSLPFSLPLPGLEEPAPTIDVADIHEDGLAFAALTDDQKIVYKQVLDGVMERTESLELTGANKDDIDPAYHAMMVDHPELFWLDGSTRYVYYENGGPITLTPGLSVPLDEVDGLQAQIDAAAAAYEAALPEAADDYTKAKVAYDYVIATTDYDLNATQSQNIQSVFVGHESVCAGYARAYQYLLDRVGVPCSFVEGTIPSTGQDHAWNIVCLGGEWTFVDVTWGDPTYEGLDAGGVDIVYDYLGLTTEELLRDDHVFADQGIWPVCESKECGYYAREGLELDEYDEGALSVSLWAQYGVGARPVVFKFTNEAAYAQARGLLDTGDFLIDDIRAILTEAGTIESGYQYSYSDALYIIKLFL